MARTHHEIDLKEVTNMIRITVRVRGARRFRVRMWVVGALLKMAAWMCPVQMELEVD